MTTDTKYTAASGTASPAISLRGGIIKIDGTALIDTISCVVERGTVTGLIGQNGSGKSTLLRAFSRQQPLTEGTLLLDKVPFKEIGTRAFAQRVAYLPQALPPTPGLTVRELVALGRYPWHGALGRFTEKDAEAVERAINITETGALADRFVDQLSGGERQRCWLAMMLAQEAEVLLLDEPISALDIKHQVSVMELIHRIAEENELAILVVIHDVNLAAHHCHKILALKTGILAWQGVPADLMDQSVLEAIYDVRMELVTSPKTGLRFALAKGPASPRSVAIDLIGA